MSSPVRLASFCRLCLSKTKDKVPVFANGNLLDNLLHLIEILIDPDDEPDAVVCYDCVVTLEGFHQFKEQCHVNDEFVKTVPTKLDCSAASADLAEGEEEEEEDDEDEDNPEEGYGEEEDRLELSEAEEVFQDSLWRQSTRKKTVKSKKKKKRGRPAKSPKKSPVQKPIKQKTTKALSNEEEEHKASIKNSKIDELQVLAESYPDFFYFEKGARSIYYTILFYGERYNSAIFTERSTYWQCIHRRKYQCPAQVVVTNDYKTFERRYEHTHGQLPEKEGQAFTPHEALPEIFQICKRIVLQKRVKKSNLSFEGTFQEFAADTSIKTEDDEDPETANSTNETKPTLPLVDESDEETEVIIGARPKRKIKPNARYSAANIPPKKRTLEPETKPIKQLKTEPKAKAKMRTVEKRKPDVEEMDESEPEDVTMEEPEEEEDLDLDKIEEECDAFNVPKKPARGPPLEEQLVLADSYPDFFFFEKGPRSVYFTLVYYGERFHSAVFTENNTYWHCQHRRKYRCPAQVCVSNDYKTFERRYEHTHPDLPAKEGQAFTPKEALPELFDACRKIILKNRAKRRKKLLDKYKFLQAVNPPTSEQEEEDRVETVIEVQDEEEEAYDEFLEEETIVKDDEYEELIEEAED